MNLTRRDAELQKAGGSILIEVVVAVVLLAVLVVPLATAAQSAVSRAQSVRNQAEHVTDAIKVTGGEAWEWGTAVASAWWRPGPVLHLEIEERGAPDHIVGLWVDGWFVGEESPDPDGRVRVEAPTWSGLFGRELVLRTRERGGAWGPPWRSVVPAADGGIPSPTYAGEGVVRGDQAVVHVPTLGNPLLRASWAGAPLDAGPLGMPFVLPPGGSGCCGVSLEGGTQSWWMESGRALDVYF